MPILHDRGHTELLIGTPQPFVALLTPHQSSTSVYAWDMDHIGIL